MSTNFNHKYLNMRHNNIIYVHAIIENYFLVCDNVQFHCEIGQHQERPFANQTLAVSN